MAPATHSPDENELNICTKGECGQHRQETASSSALTLTIYYDTCKMHGYSNSAPIKSLVWSAEDLNLNKCRRTAAIISYFSVF
jgi:hypothetical protein